MPGPTRRPLSLPSASTRPTRPLTYQMAAGSNRPRITTSTGALVSTCTLTWPSTARIGHPSRPAPLPLPLRGLPGTRATSSCGTAPQPASHGSSPVSPHTFFHLMLLTFIFTGVWTERHKNDLLIKQTCRRCLLHRQL